MDARCWTLALALTLLVAAPASAADVVDQSLVGTGTDGTQIRTAYPRAAQTFLPGWTGTLTGVRLWLGRQGAAVPVVVQLRTTADGRPTDTVLASAPVTAPGAPVQVALPPTPVTAGQMYAIVVDVAGATGDSYMWTWNGLNGDPYPIGARWTWSGGWSFSGGDLAFQTLMVDDEVAPTTTLTPGSGWRSGPADVTADAADGAGGTGVVGTRCWVDPPAPPTAYTSAGWRSCAGIAVSGEGTHRVWAASIDARGNAEVPHVSEIRIDATAPTTTAAATIGDVPGAVPVTLTARDAGSGVAATYYAVGVDPGAPVSRYDPAAPPVLERGERIRFRSVDAVGNLEPVQTTLPRLAAPAPPLTVGVPGPERVVVLPAPPAPVASRCPQARAATASARRLVAQRTRTFRAARTKARRRTARRALDQATRRLATAQAAERAACR